MWHHKHYEYAIPQAYTVNHYIYIFNEYILHVHYSLTLQPQSLKNYLTYRLSHTLFTLPADWETGSVSDRNTHSVNKSNVLRLFRQVQPIRPEHETDRQKQRRIKSEREVCPLHLPCTHVNQSAAPGLPRANFT